MCGQFWIDCYIDSLSCNDKKDVEYLKSSKSYRFGSGDRIIAKQRLAIPVYIGDKKVKIVTDVIDANIPLLLSKSSLQRAEAKIDFENNQVVILNQVLPLTETSGGQMDARSEHVQRILFTSPFSEGDAVHIMHRK